MGAIITFLLGRYVFRDVAILLGEKYPVINALDKAIESEGFKLILLLRLCPVVPFTIFNFLMGVT